MAIVVPVKTNKRRSTFPYAGVNRIRFKGTLSILFRIPLKPW
jgi:hypothetical protein